MLDHALKLYKIQKRSSIKYFVTEELIEIMLLEFSLLCLILVNYPFQFNIKIKLSQRYYRSDLIKYIKRMMKAIVTCNKDATFV